MYDAKVYPDYVSGTGYVISGPLVPILFKTALHEPLFHLEDVFTTGMVAKQANVTPENNHLFSFVKHPTNNPCLYRKIITSHGLNPDELRTVWRKINDPRIDCSTVQLPKIGDPKFKKCRKAKRLAVHHGARRGWSDPTPYKESWALNHFILNPASPHLALNPGVSGILHRKEGLQF